MPSLTIALTGNIDGSGNLLTTEAGSTSTFIVVLDNKPTANVTVSITGDDTTEHSLSAYSLTFTTNSWDTPQTVTVTGVDDSLVDGDITTTLTAIASNTGGYAGTETATITVKNTDDETGGISIAQTGTTDGSGNLLTTEAGSTSTFTVVLDAKPTANVTVSITGDDTTEHSLSASSLTFTTDNWNTAQTVTVTGVDDSLVDGDITTTLNATASNSGGYAGTETATTTLKTSDNDSYGLTITQTGTTDGSGNLLTTEAGSTSTFTVVLDAKPTANVTVSITGDDTTEHSLSASSLTFTTDNWNTAQTVTVTGVDDSLVDGDITTTLTATASNSGGYAGTETATTTLKTSDNDSYGLTITQTGTTDGSGNLLTTEAGSTSTFTVVLDAKPTANVTVSITGDDTTEHSLSASSLTFTTDNWNTAQIVTVTGVDDSLVDGDITTTLTATASNSGGYAGTETATTTLKTSDNDASSDDTESDSENNTAQQPIALSTLVRNRDDTGFEVTGQTGLWIKLVVLKANTDWQNSLQIVDSLGNSIGSIGATRDSTNLGKHEIFLDAGSEWFFHQLSNNSQLNELPSLRIDTITGGFIVHLDDSENGDNDHDDLSIKITTSQNAENPVAAQLASEQNNIYDSILNLTEINTPTARLRITLQSHCDDVNRIGLVKLAGDKINGFTVNGIASTAEQSFNQVIRDNLINPGGHELLIDGTTTRQVEWNINQNEKGFYAPVFINQNTNDLFTFGVTSARDNHIHVKNLGSNFFGYEDTLASRNSDWDFNDITMLVEMI